MKSRGLVALCLFGWIATDAAAQQPGPTVRPPISPYLNLLRTGNSPGVNYYGLVKPQIDFRNSLQNLQQQVTNNQTAISGLNAAQLPATGHATTYLNTGSYYSGSARRAGGNGAAGARQAPAAAPPPARRR